MTPQESAAVHLALSRGYLSQQQLANAEGSEGALLNSLQTRLSPQEWTELVSAHSDSQRTLAPGSSASSSRVPQPPGGSGAKGVGPYEVVKELARGGMGIVYVARHPGLQREVALKVLLSGGSAAEEDVQRFLIEARIAARLRHPNIVGIHDVGEAEGEHYFAMDLIRGCSLKERIDERGPLPASEAAEVMAKVAAALAYAHRQAVLHRDLKPHNVLLDESGEPLLTDFGLAKAVDEDHGLTRTGQVMGTPAYMPPEQAEGALDLIDRRSDVYSFGATLFHALTGRPPFMGATTMNLIKAVLMDDPPAPRALNPEVPRDLETICLTCLAKEPSQRYASAQAVAEDLGRFLRGEPITARPPTLLDRALKKIARHRAVSLTLALAALALGAVGGGLWRSRVTAERDARASEQAKSIESARANYETTLTGEARDLSHEFDSFVAVQRWYALAPDAARSEVRKAALNLAKSAEAQREWPIARRTLEQAARLLGEPFTEALKHTENARQARTTQEQARVEELLALAAKGEVDYEDALIELVRFSGPETSATLAAYLQALSDDLTRALRGFFRAEGTQPELEEALDLSYGLEQDYRRTGRDPAEPRVVSGRRLPQGSIVVLNEAQNRVQLGVQRKATRGQEAPPAYPSDCLEPVLARDGRVRAARLACDALGRLDHFEIAVPALGRFVLLVADPLNAAEAQLALARLAAAHANPLARRFLSESLASLGAHSISAELLSIVKRRLPDLSPDAKDATHLLLRRAESLDAHPERALVLLERILHIAPSSYRAWYLVGQYRLHAGRPHSALEALDRALKLSPKSVEAYVLRASAWRTLNFLDLALADLDRAIALDDHLHQALASRCLLLLELQRPGDAAIEAARLLELLPSPAHLGIRGYACNLVRQFTAAERAYDKAIELTPNKPEAAFYAGRARARLGLENLAGARADLARAAQLKPRLPYVALLRVMFLARTDWRRAVRAAREALSQHPTNSDLALFVVEEFARRGAPHEARAELDAYLIQRPRDAARLALKARLLVGQQKLDAAEWYLASALEINPDDMATRIYRAQLNLRRKSFDAVVAEGHIMTNLGQKNGQAWSLLGQGLIGQGHPEALEEAKIAARYCATLKTPTADYLLALIADKEGRAAEAITAMERFIEVAQGHPLSQRAQQLLKIWKR